MIKYLLIALLLTGCSAVTNLDKLLVLKGRSDEEAAMDKMVARDDKRFEEMMKLVKSDQMGKYKSKDLIQRKFGPPLFVETVETGDVWIYRYSTKAFNSPKVYLAFDAKGSLIDSKFEDIR